MLSPEVSVAPDRSRSKGGALDGIRILDFTTAMAGPFATRLLADLGAEVVKIETETGDQVRARPPLRNGYSSYFGHLNAGKKSLAMNLKADGAADLVRNLAKRFDIVVENFRPGVMDRLGLGWESLGELNERLIYCSISGYGQTGPKSRDPAYAPVVHAASGFDIVTMLYQNDASKPATTGVFIADVLAGTFAFGAIQAALYQRERTGRGQFIDISLMEGMVGLLIFELQEAQAPAGPRRPLHAPLRTKDGFIMVAPISPANFEQLCEAVGHPEWRDDPRFETNAARNKNWDELLRLTEEWTSQHSGVEAEAIMQRYGVPCSRYRTMTEVLDDPQLAARSAFREIEDGGGTYRVLNAPFTMSDSHVEVRDGVSRLGEHGSEILRSDLGLTDAEIMVLQSSGAIFGTE